MDCHIGRWHGGPGDPCACGQQACGCCDQLLPAQGPDALEAAARRVEAIQTAAVDAGSPMGGEVNVYVLCHAGIEDDRYVRGVWRWREDAEAAIAATEWSDNWVVEHAARERMAQGRVPDGHRPAGTQRWEHPVGVWHERPTEEAWSFRRSRTHGDWCCGVEEWTSQEAAPAPEYGPFPSEWVPPPGPGLIPPQMDAALQDLFTRQFPLWSKP